MTEKGLLKRIKELERRVARLEDVRRTSLVNPYVLPLGGGGGPLPQPSYYTKPVLCTLTGGD